MFCGASSGRDPRYAAAAAVVGERLATRGIRLVFGGGRRGLMGVVADAALAAGGRVVGVIPRGLVDRELAHTALSELRIVDTLHERKAGMDELADAFIALPGGLGTLEELAEVLSWAQLDLHAKPIGLLDVEGYFDGARGLPRPRRCRGVRRRAPPPAAPPRRRHRPVARAVRRPGRRPKPASRCPAADRRSC